MARTIVMTGTGSGFGKATAEILEAGGGGGTVTHICVSVPNELSVKVNYLGIVALIEAQLLLQVTSAVPCISLTSSAATLHGNNERLADLLRSDDADAALVSGRALAEQGAEGD